MLIRLPELVKQDPSFSARLTNAKFVLNAATPAALCRPSHLFDPSVPALTQLLDEGCFPAHGDLRRPDVLAALRGLGLRASLSRIAVRGCLPLPGPSGSFPYCCCV